MIALQDDAGSSVNVSRTCEQIDTRLTHARSRTVRRQLLHLSSVYQGSSGYYREALRPVIRRIINQLEVRA
jgi:hypothetical protein